MKLKHIIRRTTVLILTLLSASQSMGASMCSDAFESSLGQAIELKTFTQSKVWAKKQFAAIGGASEVEAETARSYKSVGYDPVNRFVRGGYLLSPYPIDSWMSPEKAAVHVNTMRTKVALLDRLVSRTHVDGSVLLYRALYKPHLEKLLGAAVEESLGRSYVERSFSSTSTLLKIAKRWARRGNGYEKSVILRIHVQADLDATYLDSFNLTKYHAAEAEVLLQRNIRFRVLKVTQPGELPVIMDVIAVKENESLYGR
ncbi:MAG: hypothetical protein EOP06_04645 [Proteobacteria bacterium]|nr:MAG: hypothetical protein EOP06_04645 [Pseudomonadota bacterium]